MTAATNTTKINGIAYIKSTNRIKISSTTPPRKPDIRPNNVPMNVPKNKTVPATIKEILVP